MSNEIRAPFDKDGMIDILNNLIVIRNTYGTSPFGIDDSIINKIRDFLSKHNVGLEVLSDVTVWNFYKEILDMVVRYSLGSAAAVTLFNLEAFYIPPVGGLSSEDGSIHSAPWRVATRN